MTFGQRLSYFGGGLFIGVIFLIFFLSGKKTSCDYSPNARVLKNINLKKLVYSKKSSAYLQSEKIDTTIVSEILKLGNVNFSKSNTELDSCKIYNISSRIKNENIELIVENCEKLALIKEINSSKITK